MPLALQVGLQLKGHKRLVLDDENAPPFRLPGGGRSHIVQRCRPTMLRHTDSLNITYKRSFDRAHKALAVESAVDRGSELRSDRLQDCQSETRPRRLSDFRPACLAPDNRRWG